MSQIKAIETQYKGYRFRSRLEARWAVFFDAAEIDWQYEPEGFQLKDGWYLPDFWLPTFGGSMYVEVKYTGGDFSKARSFAEQTHNTIWLAEGPPDYRAYLTLEFVSGHELLGNDDNFEIGPEVETLVECWGVPNAWDASGEDRMFSHPCCEVDWKTKKIKQEFVDWGDWSQFNKGVMAARSARFEHGESP
jgi:hypothetical protein